MDLPAWTQGLFAFFAFCFASSSVYLINDLFDLESDRLHHVKRLRPIASGAVSIPIAGVLLVGGLSLSVTLASYLGVLPLLLIVGYIGLNLLYSFFLKKILLLDVMVLTSFYVIRIVMGGIVTSIMISPWMKVFSFFTFLSLAFVKRYSEVFNLKIREERTEVHGRGYNLQDANPLYTFGIVSSFMAVLVFCQYIYQSENTKLYRNPDYLWGLVPLILYWFLSLWLRAARGQVQEDPIQFVIKDRQSWAVGFFFAICVLLSV